MIPPEGAGTSTSASHLDHRSLGVDAVLARLRGEEPLLWVNPDWSPWCRVRESMAGHLAGIRSAEARFRRWAPLLAARFPELASSGGTLESPLLPAPRIARSAAGTVGHGPPPVWIKADHALPVAGSVKARGGIHAILCIAEEVCRAAGFDPGEEVRALPDQVRARFGEHRVATGSTGNLGLSIGRVGAALGFQVTVHMSAEARAWKKRLLREVGVEVVEHPGDYGHAVASARLRSREDPMSFFVDDENSLELLHGYGAGMAELNRQLERSGIHPEESAPLILHLPCGVGGAPGGIALAARGLFGDAAHAFFAEPVQAPCFLMGMATGRGAEASVRELGLTLATEADGLAVAAPSSLVSELMAPLLAGAYTVTDGELLRSVALLLDVEGLEVEPAAAACVPGPGLLLGTVEGERFLERRGIDPGRATHILWTTGGSLAPASEHRRWRAMAARAPTRAKRGS